MNADEIRHEQELEGLSPEEQLERLNPHRRPRLGDGWKLIGLGLLVGVLIGVVLFVRAWQTASSDRTICLKVDRLDAALIEIVSGDYAPTKPGQPLFDYYAHHPTEKAALVNGQAQGLVKVLRLLRSAACDPANLPAVQHAP